MFVLFLLRLRLRGGLFLGRLRLVGRRDQCRGEMGGGLVAICGVGRLLLL